MGYDASSHTPVARLFASHHPWLMRRMRRYLPCIQDAEDVVADTFTQVVQHPDIGSIVQPEAFLTTIAKRLTTRLWRKRAIERAYLERMAQAREEWGTSAEQQLVALQTLQEIDGWLHQLPVRVRLAFLYRVLDDLSHDEIALRLQVSVRTVGRYLRQAMLRCMQATRPSTAMESP